MKNYMDEYGSFKLREGAGGSLDNGLCLMELVAWLKGEGITDQPQCACPVLGGYAIRLNDRLNDENRQKLLPLALHLTGSRSKEHEIMRAEFLVIETAKRVVSIAFDKAGLKEHADALRCVKTISDVREVTKAAYAAAYAAASAAAAAADAADAAAAASAAAAYAAAAASAASAAAAAAAKAAYAAAAASAAAAYAAAYAAAAAAAKAADAADAAAYAAAAKAKQSALLVCVDILTEAIALGPNGKDQIDAYLPKVKELGDFAREKLSA